MVPPFLLTTFHSPFATPLTLSQLNIDLNAFASHLSVSTPPPSRMHCHCIERSQRTFYTGMFPMRTNNTHTYKRVHVQSDTSLQRARHVTL